MTDLFTNLLALAAAIYLLVQLQRLRAVLAYPFAPPRARRIVTPNLPEAFADLYAQAGAEAAALGFEGPHWYLFESEEAGAFQAMPLAAWRERNSGDVLWLLPPQVATAPNRLTSWFVRRLTDGRHCVGQPFDCYAEIAADTQILGHTLRGDTLASQWQRHDEWCTRQGAADLSGCDDASLDWQAAGLHRARIESLLRRGKLYRDSGGRAVPTLAFAWQLLGALRRQPRPDSAATVPPARMVWLANISKRVAERPAPRRMQALLFAVSVLLFLAAGGWFWGLRFALILFVVVGIHELGHYLAMRAFGYRNVQMLALPLVGGVTIGFEARPDAARRAWMSLMGPLPGIVIGWGLVLWQMRAAGGADPLLVQAALVFLFLNYLNVLPVPPLDGAHVVQELLPAGAPRLSAVFIALACLAGAALSVWFGFYVLAAIAALQLPHALARWRLADVLARLRNDAEMHKSRPLAARQRRVFEAFDQVSGPTPLAVPRLGQAAEALRSLDVQPMRPLQRLVVGSVYVLLLAGPVLAGLVALAAWRESGKWEAHAQKTEAEQASDNARWRAEAAALALPELLEGLRRQMHDGPEPVPPLPPPADEAALAQASQRLGVPLPDELLAFYRVADGDPVLGLRPLADLSRAGEALRDTDIPAFVEKGDLAVFLPQATESVRQPFAVTREFVLLGGDTESGEYWLYDTAPAPAQAGLRHYELGEYGGASVVPGLRSWMEARWVRARELAQFQEEQRAARALALQGMADWTQQQLIAAVSERGLLARLFDRSGDLPGPASAEALGEAQTLAGHALTPGLAALYARHDGFPPLGLLPLRAWRRVETLDTEMRGQAQQALEARHAQKEMLDMPSMDPCISIGGGLQGDEVHRRFTFWCPQNSPAQQILGGYPEWAVADVDDLLRNRVFLQRAWQQNLAQ